MHQQDFESLLQEYPIIAALKSTDDLLPCLRSEGKIIFILRANLLDVGEIVRRAKAAGKMVFVHIDLIDGLDARDISVDYIAASTDADGILSTKSSMLRRAKTHGLYTVQRFFLLDSIAFLNVQKQFSNEYADAIEILPGSMPKVIQKISSASPKPIIAGGLIFDKQDIMSALSAGASAVSSSNPDLWIL